MILSFRQRRNRIDFNGFFISFHSILNDKNGIMNEYGHSILFYISDDLKTNDNDFLPTKK